MIELRKCDICKQKKEPMAFVGLNEICRVCTNDTRNKKKYKIESGETKRRVCLGHDCGAVFTSLKGERMCPKCSEYLKKLDADEHGFCH